MLAFVTALCLAPPADAGPLREMFRQFVLKREAVSDRAAVASLKLPAGASVTRDVSYGPGAMQRLDIYRPARPHNAPVIVMVHGGGWAIGDKVSAGVVQNKIDDWLPKGYVFVSVDYPMLPEADPLEQAKSVGRALAYVQKHAAEWGGNPDRIVVMGHSAGAHLVALLAADATLARKAGARPWLGTVSLDSAALDVPAIMQGRHLPLYDDAFGKDPAFWREVSPVDNIVGKPAPMLLVCSSRRSDSCHAARRFQDALRARGTHVRVAPVNLSHMEINRDLGRPSAYTAKVEGFLHGLGLP